MSIHLPNPENDYYWQLVLKDNRTVLIPPKGVEVVRHKMATRQPIHTRAEMIPFSEIKGFEKTSKRFTNVQVVEETARALNEPVVTDSNEVKARWVKKQVSKSEYDKKYAKVSFYRYLSEGNGFITVAFLCPIHKINLHEVAYCTTDEETRLS